MVKVTLQNMDVKQHDKGAYITVSDGVLSVKNLSHENVAVYGSGVWIYADADGIESS